MRKELFSTLIAILALTLLTSTVFAAVRLRQVFFEVDQDGSLIVRGTATGFGNQELIARLVASGPAVVSCYNRDGELMPEQEYTIIVDGVSESIFGGVVDNGIQVAIIDSGIDYDNECPNDNWSAEINFVSWSEATIMALDRETGEVLLRQDYVCTTIRYPTPSIACTPVSL